MPHPRPHRRPVAVAALAGVVLAVLAPAGTAWAGTQLLPGATWSTPVDLPDAWADQADRLGVSVVTLDQQENDCLRPEVRAGDQTCAADEGDLAGQVSASIAAGRYDDGTCVAATAPAALALTGGAVTRLALAGPQCLVLTFDFPDGADDDVAQSDTLGVGLSLVAAGSGADVGAGDPGGGAASGGAAAGGVTGGGGVVGGTVVGGVVPPAGGPSGAGRDGAGAVGPGSTGQATAGRGAAGAVDGPVGAGERVATAVADGVAVGSATADVEVGADGASVEAESAQTLLEDPFALGALLLGLTLLLWVLLVLLRRRRREEPA
ncbi:hypothetical protein [Modestobacter sp. Leaf380]|uniref:hypothetical protein n=1 Tax=Modestobacter sp. Leaf380 TaxID=1736356 RepID=UPI00070153EF|nr:hypothetical protein [Modestobacter sp. Leaf380]KQS63613.1 hypothetical protein ASG41_18360 [Modestobacter sp. Leaf380]